MTTSFETLLIVSRYVAGRKEAQILKKLNEADPEDKKHIVRMEHLFEHRGHLCIVTESLRYVVHCFDWSRC